MSKALNKIHNKNLPVLAPSVGVIKPDVYQHWEYSLRQEANRSCSLVVDIIPRRKELVKTDKPPYVEGERFTAEQATLMNQQWMKAQIVEDLKTKEQLGTLFALIWGQINLDFEQRIREALSTAAVAQREERVANRVKLIKARQIDPQAVSTTSTAAPITGAALSDEEIQRTAHEREPPVPSDSEILNDFYMNRDPVVLIQLIHTIFHCLDAVDSKHSRREAVLRYHAIRMTDQETIQAYQIRFQQTAELMELSGGETVSEEYQVYDFLQSLNVKFQAFVNGFKDQIKYGQSHWPTTFKAAMLLLLQHAASQQPTATVEINDLHPPATSFIVSDAQHQKRGRRNNRNRVSSSPGADAPTKPVTAEVKPPRSHCRICFELFQTQEFHWYADCPQLKQLKANKGYKAKSAAIFDMNPNIVCLDSGASVHLFQNPLLLSGLCPSGSDAPSINGATGSDFKPKFKGHLKYFGKVFHDPCVNGNLLSMGIIEKNPNMLITKCEGNLLVSIKTGPTLKFTLQDNIYVCDLSQLAPTTPTLVATVAQNLESLTGNERRGAQLGRELIERLGYPSDARIIAAINNGAIVNLPCTSADVARATRVFGKNNTLKGKTVTPSTTCMLDKTNQIDSVFRKDQVLHLDIFQILGNHFLLGFAVPLGLLMVEPLASHSSTCIKNKLERMLNLLKKSEFLVTSAVCDNEQSLLNAIQAAGLPADPVPPGRHDPIIERQIRQVKERARAIIHALPYLLPISLLSYLLSFVIASINILPSNSDYVEFPNLSAREKFLKRKTDFTRDIRISFGEFVQVFNNSNVALNSMTERTIDALAMFPANDVMGSVYFFNLSTRKLFKSSSWTVQPMPDRILTTIASIDHQLPRETFDTPDDNVDAPRRELDQQHYDLAFDDVYDATHPAPIAAHEANDAAAAVDALEPVAPATDPVAAHPTDAPADALNLAAQPSGPTLRRSSRTPVPRTILGELNGQRYETTALFPPASAYHLSIKRATQAFGAEMTQASLLAEMKNLLAYNTFEPVQYYSLSPAEKSSIIRSTIFLKDKYDQAGTLLKLKSRLVAGGDQQDKSLYPKEDVTAPTVSTTSLLATLALASREKRSITTLDIGSAYLNADIGSQSVLMSLDQGLAELVIKADSSYEPFLHNGRIIVKLKKGLYGCVESARLWFRTFSSTLVKLGAQPNPYDPCVYNFVRGADHLTLCVHVDDVLLTSTSPVLADWVVSQIEKEYRTVTVQRGSDHSYLGMRIRTQQDGTIHVDMARYLSEITSAADIKGTANSPASNQLFCISESPALSDAAAANFRTTIAKLLYAGTHVRPDLMLAISFLTARASQPTNDDEQKLKRILRYVNATKDLPLVLGSTDPLRVETWIDSSYGSHGDATGHTGGLISLGRGAINAKSTKQRLVVKSSTESELVGIHDYISQAIFVRNFLIAQGHEVPPVLVHHDNLSTIAMIERGRHSGERTKHIDMRYFFVKDRIASGHLQLVHTPTADMIADLLTKPLQGQQFTQLRDKLLGLTA